MKALDSSDLESPPEVTLQDGTKLTGKHGIVVATDQPAALQLLGSRLEASPSKAGKARGTCNVYFRQVVPQKTLQLHASGLYSMQLTLAQSHPSPVLHLIS